MLLSGATLFNDISYNASDTVEDKLIIPSVTPSITKSVCDNAGRPLLELIITAILVPTNHELRNILFLWSSFELVRRVLDG